jgi:hypothetical protein
MSEDRIRLARDAHCNELWKICTWTMFLFFFVCLADVP